jgi:hypothetical protein
MKKISTLFTLILFFTVYNGTAQIWQDMDQGLGLTGESVKAIAVDPSGNIYVGGTFTGPTISYLAKWNGTAWENVGTGVNGPVYAIGIKTASDIYVGGAFTMAGGTAVSNIARWSGSAWSDIGGGFNDQVNCIFVPGSGIVYAGGKFSQSSGVAMNHIARLSGTAWTQLGAGINSPVNAIAEHNGNIHAGCEDLNNPVKKFDGTAWSDLTGISGGKVFALASFSGNLYAGGEFSMPFPAAVKHDGSSWSSILTTFAFTDKIYCMLSRNGVLLLGGKFTNLGLNGAKASYIAKKPATGNPIQSITDVTSVLNDEVYAIGYKTTPSSNYVIAGGKFSNFNHVAITATTIGIDEISDDVVEHNFYPNPVKEKAHLFVKTSGKFVHPELKILDLQARIIPAGLSAASSNPDEIDYSIDCSQLARGTYYYLLTDEGRRIISRQFVIE